MTSPCDDVRQRARELGWDAPEFASTLVAVMTRRTDAGPEMIRVTFAARRGNVVRVEHTATDGMTYVYGTDTAGKPALIERLLRGEVDTEK